MANAKTHNLPAIIAEKGLPIVRTNQELIAKVHNVFTSDRYVVLVPKAMNIGEKIKVAIQILELDGNNDLKKNKDFWAIKDSDEANLSANAINKLAAKANVRFTPALTGISESKYDESDRPLRLRAKAHCTTIDSLGNLREGIGEYEYNYKEDLANKTLTPFQREQRHRFAIQMTITGAQKRAFFQCLGIDKSISKKDIGKPFIVPCVIDDIDYNDPEVKGLIARRSLGIQEQLYGPERKRILAECQVDPDKSSNRSKHQTDQAPVQEEAPTDGPPPDEKKPEPTSTELRGMYEDEWRNSDSKQRAEKIRQLAEKTEVDITGKSQGKSYNPPEEWNIDIQMKWIMGLAEQAGEIPKAED